MVATFSCIISVVTDLTILTSSEVSVTLSLCSALVRPRLERVSSSGPIFKGDTSILVGAHCSATKMVRGLECFFYEEWLSSLGVIPNEKSNALTPRKSMKMRNLTPSVVLEGSIPLFLTIFTG